MNFACQELEPTNLQNSRDERKILEKEDTFKQTKINSFRRMYVLDMKMESVVNRFLDFHVNIINFCCQNKG